MTHNINIVEDYIDSKNIWEIIKFQFERNKLLDIFIFEVEIEEENKIQTFNQHIDTIENLYGDLMKNIRKANSVRQYYEVIIYSKSIGSKIFIPNKKLMYFDKTKDLRKHGDYYLDDNASNYSGMLKLIVKITKV